MPNVRYYHHGKYQQPSKAVHFLPPLRLTTTTLEVSNMNSVNRRVQNDTRRSEHNPQTHSKRFYTRYKKLLFTIASSLTATDINDLKCLCRDHVRPTHHIDDVRNSWSFILLLENKKLLAHNSLVFLQTLLYYVGRTDLYSLVLRFRADRQNEYKGNGVEIHQHLKVREQDTKKMELAREMLDFRRKLKNSRRNNKPNLTLLQQRLSELSIRVQQNIGLNTMNNYNSRSSDNQRSVRLSIQPVRATDNNERILGGLNEKNNFKSRPTDNQRPVTLIQPARDTNNNEDHNIGRHNEMNSYKSRPTDHLKPITLSIQPTHKTDNNEDDQEILICDESQVRDRQSGPDYEMDQETLGNIKNKYEDSQMRNTKENETEFIKETDECSTQFNAPEERLHNEEYFLSEEAILAETPFPPLHRGEEFIFQDHNTRNKREHTYSNIHSPSVTHLKHEKNEEKNVPLKIKQIRKRFGKDNWHKMRYQHNRSKRIKKRKKRKRETKEDNLDSDESSNSESEEYFKFPNIYEKYARFPRLSTNASKAIVEQNMRR
ncbi:uncharacterized protein LOC117104859 [Anneissia japonica]|uniref:uncharacterized protein LOC117104859 n=1 Tax=Anneissia japonica TaxID=1529436 RepID=UPI001425714B|nr:uncharacterized protein LOC117104859 [Anneissia japonica]